MKESIGRLDIQREPADEQQSIKYYNNAEDPFQRVAVAENRLEELRKELTAVNEMFAHLDARKDTTAHINERVLLRDEYELARERKKEIEAQFADWERRLETAEDLAARTKKILN